VDVGNDGVGVHDIMTNVESGRVRVYCKFGLEVVAIVSLSFFA